MDCLQIETTTNLIKENEVKHIENRQSIYIRFFRKKYKCIIMWFLSIISISQLFVIILEKIDSTLLMKIVEKIHANSTTQENTP
jgi:hypothetical protein